jgi:hypothetical protein
MQQKMLSHVYDNKTVCPGTDSSDLFYDVVALSLNHMGVGVGGAEGLIVNWWYRELEARLQGSRLASSNGGSLKNGTPRVCGLLLLMALLIIIYLKDIFQQIYSQQIKYVNNLR